MEMKQISTFINAATKEALGTTDLVANEDLSNVVDIGTAIFNANAVDAYVKALVNRIGRTIFVDRVYGGNAPSLVMDAWEFGSVAMKVQAELPEASENQSWDIEDGESIDQNIFYKPNVTTTFFNKRVTFEVRMSFMDKQVKQSFNSAEEMNAFLSMLYNSVENSMTVKLDALIMKTVNNMIGETFYDDFGSASASSKTGVKAVNLLYKYNTETYGESTEDYLTADDAIHNADFIRYATFVMGQYSDWMKSMSTIFNIDRKPRFTPDEKLHVVLLSEFKNAARAFLQSDTFHDQYVALPNAETVPYWQGSGDLTSGAYAFDNTSKIDIVTAGGHDVALTGILGVMFDRDAAGVTNMDRRVTTNYNAAGEFFTSWFKMDAGYFNSLCENFVVFFIA